jgi:hypothetical protein
MRVFRDRWHTACAAHRLRRSPTAPQVNSALDEVALHAEQIARWMALARSHDVKRVPADERKRATELYHGVAVGGSGRGRWHALGAGASAPLLRPVAPTA